ncbi:hypothetical protein H257_09384 [Aphanomyces astaci]|uniref:Uncharacterized protein n=1 Tax=Aphanomyces astaci TaxID=112090 RepID=W4GDD6_APHAT|nr:hypothetical protein H257_09384 [Aphanomyces astaci]ETV76978.1 hypothetical protein H257_09384 [Aphanomyces astaci]|eukprot:XP_009833890.1 hypothetical protein H257_09384 [Aphanomyces astaci]
MSLPPTSSSRAALPITHRLVGTENYDDWFLELTSIILPGEALDSMATQCTESDVRRIRHHLDAASNVQLGTTTPSPLTLDTHKVVLIEWLSINRSTNEVLVKTIRADIDEDQEHATAISVYQRLHEFKFRPHASLDANLQAFDKLRTAVEKLEGHPLSDSHLASALLAALPSGIMQDYYMWLGPKPSIPYQDMLRLLEQHWPDLTLKYPSILGPEPTALADGYGQAAAAPWGAQGQDPMANWCGYCLSSCSHSTFTCTKFFRAFHQNADGLPSHLANYPPVVVVDELKADPAATAVANATAKAAGVVEEPGHAFSTSFAKAMHPVAHQVTHQAVHQATPQAAVQATPAWDKAVIPATPVSITAIIATINAAVARFVSRPPAIVVAPATGTATTAKTAGTIATTAGITATTAYLIATTADLIALTAAPTKMTGTTVAAVTPCTTTGAIVAAAVARRRSTKATPNRPPPPSVAKAAARRAALPER